MILMIVTTDKCSDCFSDPCNDLVVAVTFMNPKTVVRTLHGTKALEN